MASGGATSVQLYWEPDPEQDASETVYRVAFRNAEDLVLDTTPNEFIFEDATPVSFL